MVGDEMMNEQEIRATAARVIAALTVDSKASATLLLDAMIHATHALMLTLAEDAPELVKPGVDALRAMADSIETARVWQVH